MAANQKAKAKGERTKGKVKKVIGDAVGNESMAASGRAQESKGDLRAAKEKAKDAIRPK
ncbi:CsbD family protein [Streptomyces sp. NPDC057950]|uniref:CsbD family protein n=1 Tax=Streptomyces sp. NPDC057950 TaxID=3346288 RepID=UPI0036EE9EA9